MRREREERGFAAAGPDALDAMLARLAREGRTQGAPSGARRRVLEEVRLRGAIARSDAQARIRRAPRFRPAWGALCVLLALAGTLTIGSRFYRPGRSGAAAIDAPAAVAASPEYVSLPYSDLSIANGTEATVRVTLPYAQLVAWGVPSPGRGLDDEVAADLVLGDDGLPLAVRVVSPTGTSFQEMGP